MQHISEYCAIFFLCSLQKIQAFLPFVSVAIFSNARRYNVLYVQRKLPSKHDHPIFRLIFDNAIISILTFKYT